ncbi:MAG: copper-translocating P-type ATPase [Patescibacteria group bacterium]|nr:copper-translocating P-type ATPase [Patescibacteria group bacterium]
MAHLYSCPMHPEIQEEHPGMCSICGMKLHEGKAGESHKKHEGHNTDIFLRKFWVSLILSIPVVLYSQLPQVLLGWSPPSFLGSEYIPALLGSIVFFYGGWIFLASAFRELKAKAPGMMTLISLAIITAYTYSIFVVITGGAHTLFWELTTLIAVMLLGHWIEMRAVQGAQGALKALSKLLPDTAELINGKKVSLNELKEGDIIFIRPGGRLPADGIVTEGNSDVDESMITGESKPVTKKVKNEVIAGTINGNGSLKVKVSKVGEDTFLSGIMRLVKEAQASKSKLQVLSDRAAYWLTIVAIATGSSTFLVWILVDAEFSFALERLVAVLVIACPHALGLAIPLVASISTTKAAQNGFLVRERMALESARNIDMVLFDKTGTLTKGEYGITNIWSIGVTDKELLQLAASVDSHSEHFISRAITKRAKDEGIQLFSIENFIRMPGKGVKGTIQGKEVRVGGAAILEGNASVPDNVQVEITRENTLGKTIIYVVEDNKIIGAFALIDLIREESREAIQNIKDMGLKVGMITGDSDKVASWVAKELNITEYFARVLPEEKSDKVKLFQQKGRKVAMVGDGINDAPALVQADLGIAIGAGTNVAIESAGIILMQDDPRDITKIIKLSRLTYTKMIQNLFWAAGYNVLAIPIAAGVLASQGILLQPAVAAVFMSVSTIIVAANAMLLRNKKLS